MDSGYSILKGKKKKRILIKKDTKLIIYIRSLIPYIKIPLPILHTYSVLLC